MRKIFAVLSILVMLTLPISAKEGKIKLGNQITYEGSVSNKQADGTGCVYIKNPQNKKEYFALISGSFRGITRIQDVIIESNFLPSIHTIGNGTLIVSSKNKKEDQFKLELTNSTIYFSNDTLQAHNISIDASLEDNLWETNVSSKPFPWMMELWNNTSFIQNLENDCNNGVIVAEDEKYQTPQILHRMEWNANHLVVCLNIVDGNALSICNQYYVLGSRGEYVYKPEDNEFVNVISSLSFRLNDKVNSWSGYRVIAHSNGNITIIHRINAYAKDVSIEEYSAESFAQICNLISEGKSWGNVKPISSYTGTIKELDKVCNAGFSMLEINYLTGKYIEQNKTGVVKSINWYNGEEESIIRTRLGSKGVSARDLQDAVLKGSMSEETAVKEQIKRNEWQECRRKGILPYFSTRSDIETFLKWQPKQIGNYLNDWKTVTKLCSSDPASASYRSQDPLDLEIYRQSAQYNADVKSFREYKNNFYAFTIPLENVSVDGNSFTLKVRRGWYRGLCKTKRENYLYLEYYSGNSSDGTFTFVVPIKRQNLKPKYFDYAPDEITYQSSDLQLLKKIRDTNMLSKVELYMVFKPGCIEDPKEHQSWRLYYLNPVGLYLIDSMTGKIILDMSSVLGSYSEEAVKEILREQKRYNETK